MWVFYAVLAMAVYAAGLLALVHHFRNDGVGLDEDSKFIAATWPLFFVLFVVAGILVVIDSLRLAIKKGFH